ncbi:MAG: hypothetical protein AAFO72_13560 [Pseudomonadota bacterium]
MKKRNKPHRKAKAASGSAKAQTPVKPERRAFLSRSGQVLIGAAVIGGGSVFAVSAVRATAREQDISRIGQGVPTVVQIHDPGCSLCSALQKETRKALKGIDPTELDYVVANIKTDEGGAFALAHGQPHVTLMLMDPEGAPVQILSGPQDRNDLRRIFTDFAASYQ